MSNNKQHHNAAEVASVIALGATGVAAFTTAFPLATGILAGAAVISSGIAGWELYESLKKERVVRINATPEKDNEVASPSEALAMVRVTDFKFSTVEPTEQKPDAPAEKEDGKS